MRRLAVPLLLAACLPAAADHPADKPAGRAVLTPGLGDVRHPVSTRVPEAQQFFDQGLAYLYAFNHDEATRSFARAAELDPALAMAYWGVAVSKGPNYNLDADDEQWKAAYAALQTALKLADAAPEPERDYVRALAKRYGPDPKADRKPLAAAYKQAMGELARKYPDDLDAATLYAESAMNLRPWKLWGADGKPAEGTEEILAVLESVLRRNPNHTGANHYYIHAVEASPAPERGLASAARLRTLAPAAGHLVHMPAHIHMRVGDYAAAADANERAAAADEAYIRARKPVGAYPMMYYPHNLHFLAAARAFQGRAADAQAAADRLTAHVGPHVAAMPMLEGFLVMPHQVRVRFHKWDDILAAPPPPEAQKTVRAVWHFTRALAHLAKGDAAKADREREAFRTARKAVPEEAMVSDQNSAAKVLLLADTVLDARFALAGKDRPKAVSLLRAAVKLEDELSYVEPPDWILPTREALGAALLLGGEAAEAETVFRDNLRKYPREGRSLFGLRESLTAGKKDHAARLVDLEFRAAWAAADPKELRIEDY
jgi:hypothetical protein